MSTLGCLLQRVFHEIPDLGGVRIKWRDVWRKKEARNALECLCKKQARTAGGQLSFPVHWQNETNPGV